jgi:hypothetical protein
MFKILNIVLSQSMTSEFLLFLMNKMKNVLLRNFLLILKKLSLSFLSHIMGIILIGLSLRNVVKYTT